MKKITLTFVIILTVFIVSTSFILSSKQSTGIAGWTNSPSEGNCGNCHGGGTSAASGITITASPSFSNNTYIAGNTYTINVDVAATGFSKFGFGCEMLNSANTNAGLMQNPGTGVKFLTSAGRKNAVHTTPKTGAGLVTFSYEWVAPASGNVTIYVGANAVNGNGTTSGDFTFNSSLTITESLSVGIKENNSTVLSQVSVYPNPAHESTTLSYFLIKEQLINIKVIDLHGKLVKEILDETQSSGFHSKIINLQDVAPGIYFVKTSANNQTVSQKLISVQ
ncbi:MAG: choice-of-anchor V domain-containing protein [Bacteroidota bacterium]|nr:choice-of-anchor V domain-containing protein [Bacteroidota bacterium]MDP3146322.1 choice-of-anchor V domain-containing protein [Bacteroidota bacterium]MDP3556606.1 choice-of-anchor V domain-containing protein [Bacteroidota bacterium]